jgi:hypothetical protein
MMVDSISPWYQNVWRAPPMFTSTQKMYLLCFWYGASLGGSKTRKRDILRVFSMSNLSILRWLLVNDKSQKTIIITIKYYININHSNKVFRQHIIKVLLIILMCHTPIDIRETRALFQQFDDEIYPWNSGRHVRLMPIGASARPMVALSGFYESHKPPPSCDACGIVPAHRNGHWNSQQSGYILHNRCVDCVPGCPPGQYGAVVTRWQCSVASGEALVMLHQDVHSVLHRRTAMAIEMAHGGGTFVRPHHLFRLVVQRLSSPLRLSSQSQISC